MYAYVVYGEYKSDVERERKRKRLGLMKRIECLGLMNREREQRNRKLLEYLLMCWMRCLVAFLYGSSLLWL